jgi:hypothetical protein
MCLSFWALWMFWICRWALRNVGIAAGVDSGGGGRGHFVWGCFWFQLEWAAIKGKIRAYEF